MTPYELYMEKNAFLPAVLAGAANTVAQIPQLAQGAGGLLKMVGKRFGTKEAPSGLYNLGKSLDIHGERANEGLNEVLNKGPGQRYDPTQWHPGARRAAEFIGMNVKNPNQVMTPQRALVWGGGAMGIYHGVKGVADLVAGPKPGPMVREMPSYSMVEAVRPQSPNS